MNANQFLQRSCPVCSGGRTALELDKGELRLVKCARCSMVFANPVPREFETGDFYDHSGHYYLAPEKLESDYAPVRFRRELRILSRHCPSGRVLDVGCSTGAFLSQIEGRYDVVGTDVAGPALDYAESKGIPVRRGNFLELDFHQPFDAVTFWAVVEHLVHPLPFLEKAASVLKPGGFCFVLVPNYRSLATRILGAKYRYILPQHVNYFTARTLRLICEDRFRVISISSTHFNPLVILKDLRGKAASDAARAGLLKQTTAMKQNPALAPMRGLYHLSEWVLAKCMLADNLVAVLRRK